VQLDEQQFSQNLLTKPLLSVIIILVKRTAGAKTPSEKSLKNLKKPLDKPLQVWYNEYVRGREKTDTR
jgi:hypothetical protein